MPYGLEGYDKEYRKAEMPSRNQEFEEVPDGKYQVLVNEVEIRVSKAGNPYLNWQLKIMGPLAYRGRRLFTRNMFQTPANLGWLKANLEICGVTLKKFSDLPNHLEDLLDVCLEVTKKTRLNDDPSNYNVYFNRQIDPAVIDGSKDSPF